MPHDIATGLARAMQPGAGAADFLCLFAAVATAIVVLMLATGLALEVANACHPGRRIQPNRVNRRKWRELRHAPGSVLTIALCFAAGLFAQSQGWSRPALALSWWTGPLLLGASVIAYDAWFYWVHRLLHTRPLLRFHALHHTSVTPTVWTNHHETVVEALLNQLYFALIVFVLPIPWQLLVLHKIYDQISGMLGHAGHEHFASPAARAPWPLASTTFHDQHHAAFRRNFGHTFSLWDRLLGTLHPGYDATVAQFEAAGAARPAEAPAPLPPASSR